MLLLYVPSNFNRNHRVKPHVQLKIGSFFLILEKFTFVPDIQGFPLTVEHICPPPPIQSHLTGAAAAGGRLGPRGPRRERDEGKWVEAGGKNRFQLQPGPICPPLHPSSSGCVSLSGPDGPTRLVKRPSDSSVKSVTRSHLFWTQQLPTPSQRNPTNS